MYYLIEATETHVLLLSAPIVWGEPIDRDYSKNLKQQKLESITTKI
jgi:hypothetical protein